MGSYIIAEAGVNHNGSLDMAIKLIDSAAQAGANAVKFQTFTADGLVQKNAPKALYQQRTTGSEESQYEMLKRLELSESDHKTLLERCRIKGIDFLSTPFDKESLNFLTDVLGLTTIKFGSGEITNGPILLQAARKGVSIILSTGMSTLGEVETALACIAFGYGDKDNYPLRGDFLSALSLPENMAALQKRVTLLHCTSEYPAPVNEVNLQAMLTMKRAFNLSVGYSDHTEGIAISVAAVALGASVIEKHFTLDKSLSGPDHKASLDPNELALLVQSIRDVEQALGNGLKLPTGSENNNKNVIRKSLVAKHSIKRGDVFTGLNTTCKRPANGVEPNEMWSILGKKAQRDYLENENLDAYECVSSMIPR